MSIPKKLPLVPGSGDQLVLAKMEQALTVLVQKYESLLDREKKIAYEKAIIDLTNIIRYFETNVIWKQ